MKSNGLKVVTYELTSAVSSLFNDFAQSFTYLQTSIWLNLFRITSTRDTSVLPGPTFSSGLLADIILLMMMINE